MKRLLLEGLPRFTAALLTQAGWDVIHVSEISMSRADDADILRRARAEPRVCVTLDADFHSLLATSGKYSPSLIRVRKEGFDAAAFAALLQGIWPGIEDALDSGALVTVTERAIRARRLAGSQTLIFCPLPDKPRVQLETRRLGPQPTGQSIGLRLARADRDQR